jgi:hypothetical protein
MDLSRWVVAVKIRFMCRCNRAVQCRCKNCELWACEGEVRCLRSSSVLRDKTDTYGIRPITVILPNVSGQFSEVVALACEHRQDYLRAASGRRRNTATAPCANREPSKNQTERC